jgi:hypothetical protein
MRHSTQILADLHRNRKEIDALERELSLAQKWEMNLQTNESGLAGHTNFCGREWTRRMDSWLLHCAFCDSITVDNAIQLLKTPGVRYDCSNWTYGWPQHLRLNAPQIRPVTFSTVHLTDASPSAFFEFAALSVQYFSIDWNHSDRGILWRAVSDAPRSGIVRQD